MAVFVGPRGYPRGPFFLSGFGASFCNTVVGGRDNGRDTGWRGDVCGQDCSSHRVGQITR